MKLNNKGFAITGILYTLFILFLLILISVLGSLSARRLMMEKSIERLEESFKGKEINNPTLIKNEENKDIAPVTGQYVFNITTNFFKNEKINEYEYTGEVQKFEAPEDGYYKIEAWGAQGGSKKNAADGSNIIVGGKGGYSAGYIELQKNDTLYIYVGGQGNVSEGKTASTVPGGYNGGGDAKGYTNKEVGSGGGATDIRFNKNGNNNPEQWSKEESLTYRILVAGGGGGGAIQDATYYGYGGAGGGLTGIEGSVFGAKRIVGNGGTQTANATPKIIDGTHWQGTLGSLGQGGIPDADGTGGGGGYYGGGPGEFFAGGGGGSSYINQTILKNTTTIAGNQRMPKIDGTGTMIGKEENGYAKITFLGKGTDILYTYNGSVQTFTAPKEGIYKIEAWGAQGGGTTAMPGGKGAYTKGEIALEAGKELYIYVGEKGKEKQDTNYYNPGGWNGGGYSGKYNGNAYNYGGGGATDVRLNKADNINLTKWKEEASLKSRIMVAAGGGGTFTSITNGIYTGTAGFGGKLEGENSKGDYTSDKIQKNYAGGGKQNGIKDSLPNDKPEKNGMFGYGMQEVTDTIGWGGGGGGGYYAGSTGHGVPGGGGSSYISGYTGCIAIKEDEPIENGIAASKDDCSDGTEDPNCSIHYSGLKFDETDMKAGNEDMPSYAGYEIMKGNEGNGYARITYLGENKEENPSTDILCRAYIKKGTVLDESTINNITFVPDDCNKYTLTLNLKDEKELKGNVITLIKIYNFEE